MERFWLNFDPVGSVKSRVSHKNPSPGDVGVEAGPAEKPFPFMKLPCELRLRILSFTHLASASSDKESDGNLELQLAGDRLRIRRPFASKAADGLFLTSKALRIEALETLLVSNRLVLLDCSCELPDPDCSIQCLQFLTPAVLRRVRGLEVRLQTPCILQYDEMDDAYQLFIRNWIRLIGFIASNFTLDLLTLTIDASLEFDNIWETGVSPDRLKEYRLFYEALAKPLSRLAGLHNLKVFLACHCELEKTVTERVMHPRQPVDNAEESWTECDIQLQ